MRRFKGYSFIIIGIMSLLGALSLVLYNLWQDYNGSKSSQDVLSELKVEISKNAEDVSESIHDLQLETIVTTSPEENIFQEYETITTTELPEVLLHINSSKYLGVLYIPNLNLELPIFSEYSYDNLKKSPCRYSGTIAKGDLILAGHNYQSHFGKLQQLNCGDKIIFEDGNSKVHSYEITEIEIINGSDVQSMKSNTSEWDLTLFTCTLSGTNRVTVRAIEIY